MLYIIYKIFKLNKIRQELKKLIEKLGIKRKSITIAEILVDPQIIGKSIITSGNIVKIPMQQYVKEQWYRVYDEYASIFALAPLGTKPYYYSKIVGIIRKSGQQVYIEIKYLEASKGWKLN